MGSSQVHLARIKDGEKVAVKVQRAGLKALFDQDLKVRNHSCSDRPAAACVENLMGSWQIRVTLIPTLHVLDVVFQWIIPLPFALNDVRIPASCPIRVWCAIQG